MKPDYGIDAPAVRRGMLLAGLGGAVLALCAMMTARWAAGPLATGAAVIAAPAVVAAAYGFGMAGYMTHSSRVGKQRTRERLLDLVGDMVPWTGHEAVLDVGCGRGLMLVGAARRLTKGIAVGADLWRPEDQAGNTPEAALQNAEREGVAERVRIVTGDARDLAFQSCCFDVVLSHWVLHNLTVAADRARAVDEMLRVLRPGGVLVLADIAHHAAYLEQLAARGLVDIRTCSGGMETRIIGVLSGGSFRPRAIVARQASAATLDPA